MRVTANPFMNPSKYSHFVRSYVNMRSRSSQIGKVHKMEIKMNNNGKRVVLVTGATSGIGRAVANRFAAASDHVIAIGRKTTELKDVAAETAAHGAQAETIALDITN